MIRRVIAAVVAIALAIVGFILVLNYANRADERAMEGMETDEVLVASDTIPRGTSTEDMTELVETRLVPRQFQVGEAVTDLEELAGQVAASEIAAGEQLQQARFATPEELRGRGEYQLPEEARDLHLITVPLSKSRALGGNIAAGDTVGVFISLEAQFSRDLYVDENGNVQFSDQARSSEGSGSNERGQSSSGSSASLSLTKLVLEKVLVTRVQGGFVPSSASNADEEGESESEPADEILVTLALEGGQAEQLVYGLEFGNVWLSYEPETADEDDEDVKVVQLPDRIGNVLE